MSEVDWLDIFADNLVELMREARMSQRELADISGLSEASISYYIHKRKMPGIKAILKIAYALECDVDILVDFGDVIE